MVDTHRAELARLQGIAELMRIEERLRQAPNAVDLGYQLVHDVLRIGRADVGVLWRDGPRHGRLETVANLPEPVKDSPFALWMTRVCAHLARQEPPGGEAETAEPREILPDSLPAPLRADWEQYLPPAALWVPMRSPGGFNPGGLLLARSMPWQPSETRVLGRIGEASAHALEALTLRRRWRFLPHRRLWRAVALGGALAVFAAMFIPVPLSVLAPAELVPADPFVVRAPLNAVVQSVEVRENEQVAEGATLVTLDPGELEARLYVALQDLDIARAEYRQAQQTSMRDREASSRLSLLASRAAQAEAEANYVRDLLDRVDIRAQSAGIAIIADRQALIGKPVQIGERLMMIADPSASHIEAWLPVADMVPMESGAAAKLFPNTAAGDSLDAEIDSIDYRAQVSPSGVMAYRVIAKLDPQEAPPRVGQRGTLKLYGSPVPLFQYLFRRPWAAMRPWIGL